VGYQLLNLVHPVGVRRGQRTQNRTDLGDCGRLSLFCFVSRWHLLARVPKEDGQAAAFEVAGTFEDELIWQVPLQKEKRGVSPSRTSQ
jgi:hypothetical protein